MSGVPSCPLFLDDVFVPEDARLGEEGRGFKVVMEAFNKSRPIIGARGVGLAQGATDHAIEFVQNRQAFGQRVAVDGIDLACTLIPGGIKTATYELARALANDTDAITGSTGTTGIYDQVELGELKVKYNKASQTSGVINNVFDVYPWLQAYLGPYCMGGAANYAVRLFRG